MTLAKALNVASALFGAAGTILLFKGSFTFETPTTWMSDEIEKQMAERNERRQLLQRLGLSGLLISFILAGLSQFVD
ncbi:MAG: hypothetical protein ACHQ1H_05420 [Nitrososphaerales archaeon]